MVLGLGIGLELAKYTPFYNKVSGSGFCFSTAHVHWMVALTTLYSVQTNQPMRLGIQLRNCGFLSSFISCPIHSRFAFHFLFHFFSTGLKWRAKPLLAHKRKFRSSPFSSHFPFSSWEHTVKGRLVVDWPFSLCLLVVSGSPHGLMKKGNMKTASWDLPGKFALGVPGSLTTSAQALHFLLGCSSLWLHPWRGSERKGGGNGVILGKPCAEFFIPSMSLGKMRLDYHKVVVDQTS